MEANGAAALPEEEERIGAGKKRKPSAHLPMNITSKLSLVSRESGIKSLKRKIQGIFHRGNLNTDSFWSFEIRSSKNEWISFASDSITALLFGNYPNPNRIIDNPAEHPVGSLREVARHSLRAKQSLPPIYLDPAVLGTSFVRKVEVSINNVPVTPNNHNTHLLQYTRINRILNNRPDPHFVRTNQIHFTGIAGTLSPAMQVATDPFDYSTFNNPNGSRVPIYLDSIFPFDCKNRTLKTIDREKESDVFLPPDSHVEVKLHLWPGRVEAIFHDGVRVPQAYLDPTNVVAAFVPGDLRLSFLDVTMEYQSLILSENEHVKMMDLFQRGYAAHYPFDVVKSQHQSLVADQSYCENFFTVEPECRLAYILFLPNYATFPMENSRKPLSGYSQFPLNCTRLSVDFGGETGLITDTFERLGDRDEDHQISKRILYDAYKEMGIFKGTFHDLFPKRDGVESLVQVLVLDLKPYMSKKIEYLKLRMGFDQQVSRANYQILLHTIHPTGKAICKASGPQMLWEFKESK